LFYKEFTLYNLSDGFNQTHNLGSWVDCSNPYATTADRLRDYYCREH